LKQPARSTFTILFLLAFLAGVAGANFLSLPTEWLAGTTGLGLILSLLGRKKIPALLLGLSILGLSLGWLRFDLAQHEANPGTLDFYNDSEERVQIVGIVTEDPDRRADHTKLTIAVSSLQLLTENNNTNVNNDHDTSGNVLVKLARLPAYDYGDELRITGQLQTPFETAEFSYKDYLARYGVHSVMYYPRATRLSKNHGNFFFAALYAFKQNFEAKINQIFPEPQASFEAGLLTGSRRGIPDAILADFNETGLTHIIAISGYNIALVIAFAVGLFGQRVARRWQFPLVASLVITFTLFVGAGPSVVRAAITGLLAFYALTEGRQYHIGLAITATAAVMVAWTPAILLNDVSFQLSFAAVLGLLFVAPVFEKWAEKIPNKFAIRESLLMTMSAQVTAVPLIVFYFDRLSLVSPLANVLVAPAIPLAMLAGFLAVLVGWIFLPAGIILGFAAYGLLNYILWIAEKLAAVPLASVEVGFFGPVLVGVYYFVLVGWLIMRRQKHHQLIDSR
jgi:competence protein ComEC